MGSPFHMMWHVDMPKEGELIFSTCRVWIAGLSLENCFWPKIKPMNVKNRGKMDRKPMKTLDRGNIKNCYVIYWWNVF
jgi:hypothetical protein